MGYNVYMTKAGYALQAKLFAQGGNPAITRVEVGSGILPEGADWRTLTGLVQPRAVATSTAPIRRGCTVSLEIEYRSDLSETEEPFQITEFGVFAIGAEGDEALILYGDLSDCPDTAVPLKYGGCVRRYPVQMEMGPSADASLGYPAGAWVTHEELLELLGGIGTDRLDITIPDSGWGPDADTGGAYALHIDLANMKITERMIPYLSITPASLGTATACKLCPAARTLDGLLRVYAGAMPTAPIRASLTLVDTSWQTSGTISGSAAQLKEVITLPNSGWTPDEETGCLSLDIAWPEATDQQIPMLTVLPDSLDTAEACGFHQVCQALDGAVRVYADAAPAAPIRASLALMGLSPYARVGRTASALSGEYKTEQGKE